MLLVLQIQRVSFTFSSFCSPSMVSLLLFKMLCVEGVTYISFCGQSYTGNFRACSSADGVKILLFLAPLKHLLVPGRV